MSVAPCTRAAATPKGIENFAASMFLGSGSFIISAMGGASTLIAETSAGANLSFFSKLCTASSAGCWYRQQA